MKEYILKIEDEGYFVNDTKVIPEISDIKKIADEKAIAIMKKISKKPYKVGALSKELKIDKKAMALYVSGLEKAGLIEVEEKKNDKVLKSIYNSFSYEINQNRVKFDPRLQKKDNQYALNFFSKFISNGKFDGYICVGAPDPHGEYKSVAKDAHFATYLGMFFGQFIDLPSSLPILLDTDVISRNLFKKNLIIIGGPLTIILQGASLLYPLNVRFENFVAASIADSVPMFFTPAISIISLSFSKGFFIFSIVPS
jgi:predicted transcriptional regulator